MTTEPTTIENPEPKIRRSYKFKVECETTKLLLDYVFADNLEEAIERARKHYNIPEDEAINVYRISDFTELKLRLN